MRHSPWIGLQPLACAAAIIAGAASSATWAQQAGSEAGLATLEEVIITAQKREENLQKAPVAVAVTTGDELARAGALQLADIQKVIPDIRLDRQGDGMTVNIRGVWSTDNSPTAEAANAVHVDGAYLAKTNGLQGFLFDIERVEVAKGPQGTLYGRNANGGTINIISKRPVIGEKSAFGEFEIGDYKIRRYTGGISVPLGDSWALRVAGQTNAHRGYFLSGLDDADEKSGRASLLWKPSDVQSLVVIVDSEKVGGYGPGNNVVGKVPGTFCQSPPNTAGVPQPFNCPVPSDPRNDLFYATDTVQPLGQPYRQDSTNDGVTAIYDYDFGAFTWTTEANWRHFGTHPIGENNIGQGAPCTVGQGPAAVECNPDPYVSEIGKAARNITPKEFTSTSLETRLTSTATTPLQWVVGLYGFHDKDSGTMVGYGNMRTTTPAIEIANGNETAKSFAGFGQATYTPAAVEALHIVGGVRYTRDDKDAGGIFTRFGTGPASSLISGSDSWTATTYKVGLSYDLTPSSLLYANTSTGYKAGGFGYGPGTTPAGPIYKPEKIRAYEVGSKNRFLNDRLQVNAEGYFYKYQDYQTNLALNSTAAPGPPVLTVSTAGKATYKGGAVDVQWAVTNNDFLRVNFSRISAKYDSFQLSAPPGYSLAAFPAVVTTTDLSNTDITGVPKWSGVASFAHTFRLTKGSLNAQLASNFRGPIKFAVADVNGSANAAQVAYASPSPTALEPGRKLITLGDDSSWAMWDFSLRYESEEGDWSMTGYVHNIANANHPNFGAFSTGTSLFTESFYPPRTYGVIFSIKIKGT